jgi:phage baseplate assembly protein gpV
MPRHFQLEALEQRLMLDASGLSAAGEPGGEELQNVWEGSREMVAADESGEALEGGEDALFGADSGQSLGTWGADFEAGSGASAEAVLDKTGPTGEQPDEVVPGTGNDPAGETGTGSFGADFVAAAGGPEALSGDFSDDGFSLGGTSDGLDPATATLTAQLVETLRAANGPPAGTPYFSGETAEIDSGFAFLLSPPESETSVQRARIPRADPPPPGLPVPEVSTAKWDLFGSGLVTASGFLVGVPGEVFTVEFFASPGAEPLLEAGDGIVLGSVEVTIPAEGTASFNFSAPWVDAEFISARARDAGDLVSGFSEPVRATLETGDLVPTAVWTGAGDGGTWHSPANWSGGVVPGAGDDVLIDVAGNSTITFSASSGSRTVKSLTSAETLLVSGGTLSLAGTSRLNTVSLSGGTIGGAGAVTVAGSLTWTGGAIGGGAGTYSVAGPAVISGSVSLSRVLEATGAVQFTGTQMQLNGGHFINRGVFTAESEAAQAFTQFSAGHFTNHGIFTKRGAGTLTLDMTSFTHVAGSELRVEAGQLMAASASSYTEMAITVTPGAALRWGAATHTFNAGVGIISEEILVSTGTVNFTAPITLPVLTFTGGTIGGAGAVTVTGLFTWTGGTIGGGAGTFTAAGPAVISGSVSLIRTLEATGAVQFTGTQMHINGGHFINRGVFTAESEAAQAFTQFSAGHFTNHGIFTKRGAGTLTLDMTSFTHVAGSELRVEAGQLMAASASSYTEMAITVTPGAALRWGNATHTFNAGVGIISEEILVSTGTVNFTAPITLPVLTFTGGTIGGAGAVTVTGLFTWTGGTIGGGAGTFTAAGPAVISGSVSLIRTLEAQAAVSFTGTQLQLNGGHFINRGSFTAESAGAQAITQFSAGHFTNHGIFTKRGAGTLTLDMASFTHVAGSELRVEEGQLTAASASSYTEMAITVTPGAALRWGNATHTFNAGVEIISEEILINTGTMNFTAPITLPVLTFTGGTIGGAGAVTVTGLFTWTGGTIGGGAGTFTAAGPAVISGSVSLIRTLEAQAAVQFTGTQLQLNGGHFINRVSFTAESAGAQAISQFSTGHFTNHGIFTKRGAGTLTVSFGELHACRRLGAAGRGGAAERGKRQQLHRNGDHGHPGCGAALGQRDPYVQRRGSP